MFRHLCHSGTFILSKNRCCNLAIFGSNHRLAVQFFGVLFVVVFVVGFGFVEIFSGALRLVTIGLSQMPSFLSSSMSFSAVVFLLS